MKTKKRIREGQYWRLNNGSVVGPLIAHSDGDDRGITYIWKDSMGASWDKNGHFMQHQADHSFSLSSRVKAPVGLTTEELDREILDDLGISPGDLVRILPGLSEEEYSRYGFPKTMLGYIRETLPVEAIEHNGILGTSVRLGGYHWNPGCLEKVEKGYRPLNARELIDRTGEKFYSIANGDEVRLLSVEVSEGGKCEVYAKRLFSGKEIKYSPEELADDAVKIGDGLKGEKIFRVKVQ